MDVGFVSGCRSDQTSADTEVVTPGGELRPVGALTHYLLETLRSKPKKTKLKDLVKITRQRLARLGYTQRPQAEGRRINKPFLG